jgi:replication factor A2
MSRKLVSVSLDQIKNLTTVDHGLVIERQKISQCSIIGNVININEQTTKISYFVTDYSGPTMEVAVWKNSTEENFKSPDMPVIMEQTYIKAFGQSRKDGNGSVYFVAFHIESLTNLNELTIHLLEVIRQARDLKKMKVDLLCNKQCNGIQSNNQNGQNQIKNAPNISGFTEVQSLVLDLIKRDQNESGISIDQIFESLRSVKQDAIKNTIEFLLNEGHIYEALDEYHFKSSE